eukprot:2717730-Amphidinium_carterae.1
MEWSDLETRWDLSSNDGDCNSYHILWLFTFISGAMYSSLIHGLVVTPNASCGVQDRVVSKRDKVTCAFIQTAQVCHCKRLLVLCPHWYFKSRIREEAHPVMNVPSVIFFWWVNLRNH